MWCTVVVFDCTAVTLKAAVCNQSESSSLRTILASSSTACVVRISSLTTGAGAEGEACLEEMAALREAMVCSAHCSCRHLCGRSLQLPTPMWPLTAAAEGCVCYI